MTFDDIEIDIDRYELRRGGAIVSVDPKVFDLIVYRSITNQPKCAPRAQTKGQDP